MASAARFAPALLPLLLPLLLLQSPPALEARRLTECPRDSLTLEVPEDLPSGSTLFSWDPARLAVARLDRHRLDASGAALSQASAHARAFFGIDFAFSVVPGRPQVVLTMALPAGGSDKLQSRVTLNCTRTGGGPASLFTLELRLIRAPLRLLVELQRPRPSRWAPAGTVVATISAFSFGRRVWPDACTADAESRGRPLTVGPDGRIALAAPPLADETDGPAEWSATVACEWRGRRASQHLAVSPLRLWRRRFNRLHAAASDSGAVLAGASLRLRLGPLLLSQQGLRLRLVGSSHPALARLEPVGPSDSVGSLRLDLPLDGQPLTLTLEASDALGSAEFTSLRVSSLRLPDGGARHSPACQHPPAAAPWPWWPAPVLSAAAAAAAVAAGAVALACVCLRRRRRRLGGVKPQFV